MILEDNVGDIILIREYLDTSKSIGFEVKAFESLVL
jgi:hypothetical protein